MLLQVLSGELDGLCWVNPCTLATLADAIGEECLSLA